MKINIVEFLIRLGWSKSKSESRRMIKNGVYVIRDGVKIRI